MATEVKRRRGTTVEHSTFTGAVAELTVDLTKDTVVVHDGATQGGFPLLREDLSNVPTTAPFTHITLDTAIFDTAYTETESETQGTLYWNQDEETLSLVTNGQTIELGQKIEVHVKNQTGSQIDKGEVVYSSGTLGASGRILVTKMIADGTIAAKRILGVAAENIANGADGKVVKFGKIRKVDTSTYSNGDILWVSTTAAGAFQNTEPVQADGEIALPIAYVVYSSSNNGEIFVRVTPIDENEYQNYDAGLADIAGLTPTDDTIIVGDGTNWVVESGDTARASLGLTIGTHVQAWDAQLDTLSGLSADQATAIVAVTQAEYQQLQNIDTVTISNTQWGYLGELDQPLTQASSPTFAGLTVDGLVVEDEVRDLQSDVIENHLEIESLQDNKVEKGQLFPDGDEQALGTGDAVTFSTVNTGQGDNELYAMNQNVQTTDAVTFATVNTGQGDNELYAMNQDVQTTDDVTFNVIDVTDKVESASGFTSGVLGAGTRYDMDDGNGSFFEVDNMRIRNELRAHIFKKDIVKASNAYFFITDSAEIAETSVIADTTDTFKVLDGDENATFSHGDLLWAKNIDDDGSLQVTGVKIEVSVQPEYVWDTSEEVWSTSTVTPDSYTEFASGTVSGGIHDGKTYTEYNIYEVTSGGNLNAGDTIVRVNGGSILNDASSAQSPFIDIYDGVNTWADFQSVDKTKVRLGNLAGVSNASGYGLYTQNAFLTGSLVVGDLTKAGQYMEFDGSTLTVKGDVDITGTTIFKSAKDGSTTPTNLNEATFIDGGTIVTNTITATEIDANTITANEIASNTITASQIASNTITASEIAANTITASEITAGTITATEIATGTITANEIAAGTITATEIDVADLFAQDATVAGTLTIGQGGSFVSDVINFDDDSFLLDASTVLLSSSGTGKIALGADADNQLFNDGIGFFVDGNSNFRIGSIAQGADDYISYDTTDGLKIELGGDDLSTAIAEIRSDLIDIYLADQSTFAGIQFLSGQITLKVGADGKVASARLDATGDESAITLRADFFDFQSNDIVILGDPDQDAGTEAKIALGSNADTITIANTTAGFIASGAGEFKGYIDANNYLRLDSSGLDIKAEEFDLEAGDLLINSATSTQTAYTPANETSLISNGAFTSTVTFNDNDLDGTSGTFGTIDESVDWEADRLGTSTFLYDGTNDSVFFRIAKTADTNRVRLWQDQETLTSYFGKTLKFTATINRPSGDTWVAGDLYFKVYAEINSTLTEIATTIINYNDLTTGTPTDFDVTAFVRDDFTALRIAIEYPEQDATTGAPISYHEIEIQNVSTVIYDKTQVTLNNNGLSVFKSPIQEFTLTADDFALNGIGIKTDDISIPNLIELNRATSSMRVPDEGYANFAYTEIGGASRLYVRLSDGTLKYVNLT